MPKNILIYADGTGQAGGLRPDQRLSNVYKLYRATRSGPDSPIDPAEQVAFYDPGLGTVTASGAITFSPVETFKSIAGMAVGLGFQRNVVDCYEAILRHYEPGDRIYLFGFSRGGYTARALANVLNLCGVPTQDGEGGPLPRDGRELRAIAAEAVHVYGHGAGHPRKTFEIEREALAQRFRSRYGAGKDPNRGDVYPYFMGVFDSVAALGLPIPIRIILGAVAALAGFGVASLFAAIMHAWRDWPPAITTASTFAVLFGAVLLLYLRSTVRMSPKGARARWWPWHFALWHGKHFDRYLDPRVPIVRHALAVDETRRHFARVEWGGRAEGEKAAREGRAPQLQQRWFPGNHSDVGGSYAEEESRLSDLSLQWMLGEALALEHPVRIDRSKLYLFPDAGGPQHCERHAFRQKHRLLNWFGICWPERLRDIPATAELDPSVLERFALQEVMQCGLRRPYRPQSLRTHPATAHYYGDGTP
ncbi:DUF2235 domain-containing protein [Lysobacter silvisoli]|uniref:DUF2235 domain-containing protein n=1 Tax=Lysobacter silvisoli TaxID=2293254 RepID=A0A371K402_9GAMM|nr:DUF2235 domain-containing protein [Lysobacter silvisoli]RDZ28577.1 DUF2235 domain-containing protein [Lysobacter silvisoli]